MRTSASVGSFRTGSGTSSMRTSPASYMSAARTVGFLRFRGSRVSSVPQQSPARERAGGPVVTGNGSTSRAPHGRPTVRTMDDQAPTTPAQRLIGDAAPKLVSLTDDVLFGDVWADPALSPRDRSMITCASLLTS